MGSLVAPCLALVAAWPLKALKTQKNAKNADLKKHVFFRAKVVTAVTKGKRKNPETPATMTTTRRHLEILPKQHLTASAHEHCPSVQTECCNWL